MKVSDVIAEITEAEKQQLADRLRELEQPTFRWAFLHSLSEIVNIFARTCDGRFYSAWVSTFEIKTQSRSKLKTIAPRTGTDDLMIKDLKVGLCLDLFEFWQNLIMELI